MATNSEGGCIRTLDDQPALDVYLRRAGAERSITEDTLGFAEFALRHPLGMSRRKGEDIRVIHAGNPDDG